MIRKTLILFLPFLFLYPVSAFPSELYKEKSTSLTLKGSYKSLFTAGKTLLKRDYWSDLNRLRLEFDLKYSDSFLVKTIYDNEVAIGSLLNKDEFLQAKEARDNALFDLSRNLIDNPDMFWRHALYRLYLTYSGKGFNITAGRQRVAWGQAHIWNPTDLFNPVSPLQIEGGERLGVDALSVEYYFSPLSNLNIVYAPRDESIQMSAGARFRTNVRGYDLSMILGEFRDDRVIGFDFAGNIGDSGFRGEGVFTDQKDEKAFIRFVLSWDYSFPNTLYLLFEYLYNGGSLGKDASPASLTGFSGEIATRNVNLLAAGIGYDLTPLVRLNTYAIYDIDGKSLFLNPVITYNIFTNIDWVLGFQIFTGDMDSEYGGFSNAYYTSLEWYF